MRVRNVEARPGYRLDVTFSDGTRGTADMTSRVGKTPFEALADQRVFETVMVDYGTVTWPDVDLDIATEAVYAMVHGLPRPRSQEQVDDNELRVSLRELRRITGMTQVDVAEEAGLTQASLSHFENSPDHKLSALRRYVAALGGELEITAVIGDRRIPLHGV
jgi:DNA-binding XRE family transcriptional regulator